MREPEATLPRTRVPEFPDIMDIEASGFGSHSYPIEIGVVLGEGRRFSRLIRPPTDWQHWDTAAEAVHGLSRELLTAHGQSPLAVAHALNALLAGRTLYSDGWVLDQPWLNRLYAAAQIRRTFHLSPLELLLTEPQMQIWASTRAEVEQELDLMRHRASQDARVIQTTFNRSLVACRQAAAR
ncbi:MAG: hypothetical protein AAGG11_11960 [Pseudomonadota bacterium]